MGRPHAKPVRLGRWTRMADEQHARSDYLLKDDLIPDARLREGEADAFRHLPIAARVAELAVHAETPVNIALFGPWGSGKSSFYELLRSELCARDGGVELVRYDAWKYGGGALKRNFISSAATELGMTSSKKSARRFHRGLYENKRTVQFDPLELFRRGEWLGWVMVLLFAAVFATVAVGFFAVWISVFTDRDVSDEVSRLAPGIGARIGGFIVALGAALKVLDGAKVEVEQVVPSEDEQFAGLFQELVEEATKRELVGTTTRRLVFFIDELDRCSQKDVVSTLTSLRTFLDQRHCVFVVAADREVLEEALTEVPQATPLREEEPYYSSASAFLDKIFQHQFSLPPLRGGRLTGFARDLVQDRGGLWKRLRDEGALNGVLYTLIPSHVRAPRRVKVLLNNFATNVRVSEARGVDWLARAEEIAKLTVLQTEFPRLAGDLYEEPRLLAMLLAPPEQPTERQRVLLARHRIVEPDETSTDDNGAPTDAEEYEAPDRLLTKKESATLLSRQREDLRRYLQSRSAPDPGRDLLYLEVVGDWIGFDDPELNRLIEDEAPARPDLVVQGLLDRPVGEKLAAARLLGHLSEKEFGEERRNIVSALALVLALTKPDELGDLGDLIANVASYRVEQPLTEQQLPGMLVLALAANEQGRDLASAVLASDALLTRPESLSLVANLLPHLDDQDAVAVEHAVAQGYIGDRNLLLEAISNHPAPIVMRLMRTATPVLVQELHPAPEPPPPTPPEPTPTGRAAAAVPAAEEAVAQEAAPTGPDAAMVDDLAESLLAALDERGSDLLEPKARLIQALLDGAEPAVYRACRERGADVAAQLDDRALRNEILYAGLVAGPGGDWRRWSEPLVEDERDDVRCEMAIMSVLERLPTQPPEVQASAPDTIRDLLRSDTAVEAAAEDATERIVPTFAANLPGTEWWSSDAGLATQTAQYRVAGILADHFQGELADSLSAALAADLTRADPTVVPWDAEVARRFADLVSAAPSLLLAEADRIAATATADGTVLARLRIAELHQALGSELPEVPTEDVIAAANAGGTAGDLVTATWLRLEPPVAEVAQAVRAMTRLRPQTVKALDRRSSGMGPTDASTLFLSLVDASTETGWLSAVAPHVDNASVLEGVADRMASAGGAKRDYLVKVAATMNLTSQSERQVVGQMALSLLTSDPNQSKSEAAAALIQIVNGERYGLKAQVKEAVEAAAAAGKLGDKARKRFENMGVISKRKKRKLLGFIEV